MRYAKWFLIALVLIAAGVASTAAQASRTFKTRLAPVPIDVAMQSTIAGTGSVTAVLTGTKLSITGTFEGLKSPATIAQVHKSPVRGVRGPVLFDVPVTKGEALNGTLSGTVDLTAAQVADLGKGLLYVQVHSEKAPDGNLWGWLTAQENKR